uniref:Fatty acid desaturase domain-containing protein n=1 Tax=Chromera velia CCMP2878 TaxID=1169474 RepID=A0A0G4G6B5_9ALVE|mmetsp:Transcript_29799/g.58480  ORF Transcript_29799/g.58480 Transcript_29799/m.58480 type:complete len:338 (-) Transcript_29799:906-1919(-)|eukprot:Cvel_4230.t1-p1 / transcript=Cvel_4230.t1 / gene=Cvel_4230 / organism=Chromera_velia_CCMP2878 / gene_product=Acyl-CoA desaturase 1, putative / transcript_product=Acyl-CoA desaturase 1, putative / location=Cvel_scaffold183:20039-21049(+) / protein_length=337 / sequence_SO=supercontig / SO=protein_coding / is_pseudo=false
MCKTGEPLEPSALLKETDEKETGKEPFTSPGSTGDPWLEVTAFDVFANWFLFPGPAYLLPTVALCFKHPPSAWNIVGFLAVTWLRAGVSMSIALHRFFAHDAFQCSRPMTFMVAVLACLAGQKGPLWWAAIHRRHHRYSDTEQDPHAAHVSGLLYAFTGWAYDLREMETDLQYVHKAHCLPEVFAVNKLWFVPTMVEWSLWYFFTGMQGVLYYGLLSTLAVVIVTFWFGVDFHLGEPHGRGPCRAADADFKKTIAILSLICVLVAGVLNFLSGSLKFSLIFPMPLMYFAVGEHKHRHHHDQPRLVKRPGWDPAAQLFLPVMASLGVVSWRPEAWSRE